FAIVLRQLIDQRALARSWGAGQTDDSCLARIRKERLEQLRPTCRAVLGRRYGASQRAGVAGTELADRSLDVLIQTVSVKQRKDERKPMLGRLGRFVHSLPSRNGCGSDEIQSFSNCRAITSRWISLVPSPIVHSFTSHTTLKRCHAERDDLLPLRECQQIAFDLSRRTPYDKWEETKANMDMIPLKPERKAQLEEYAKRRGQDPAAALD